MRICPVPRTQPHRALSRIRSGPGGRPPTPGRVAGAGAPLRAQQLPAQGRGRHSVAPASRAKHHASPSAGFCVRGGGAQLPSPPAFPAERERSTYKFGPEFGSRANRALEVHSVGSAVARRSDSEFRPMYADRDAPAAAHPAALHLTTSNARTRAPPPFGAHCFEERGRLLCPQQRIFAPHSRPPASPMFVLALNASLQRRGLKSRG